MTDREMDDGVFEGRAFPSESEWLDLQLSHDEEAELLTADFVDRTMAALRDPGPDVLLAFAPPAPSADFVARTVAALQADRRDRWRELLARYVAPEPSREFVARTLQALADGRVAEPRSAATATGTRPRSWLRSWSLPLLAAAAVIVALLWQPRETRTSLEISAAGAVPVALGPAHAPSPLPALLVLLDHDTDPYALPNSGGDGISLLLWRNGR